ncbi:MAG: RNA polymerase-binding protein DksA [Gammaproteobacteria bacterium]|nr:MAG: RNA polymerase-binding protein DksA [Gammaproteobacteria bacterium]
MKVQGIEVGRFLNKEKKTQMNDAQLEQFKQQLLDWRNNITENNAEAKHKLQEDTSPLADLSDRASLEEEFALALRARDRDRKLLSKIDAALERIASEKFGYCENCGSKISVQRLEARPTAELCIDCKELQEQKEIRVRDKR